MVEIMNNNGTYSYGCCRTMRQAQGLLSYLKETGDIPAREKSVTICNVKHGELVRTVEVEYRDGRWRPVIAETTEEEISAGLSLGMA